MLALRKVKSRDLAAAVGITQSNLSLLKSGKVRGVKFSTLAAICRYLDCKPGDILDYEPSDDDLKPTSDLEGTHAVSAGGGQAPARRARCRSRR